MRILGIDPGTVVTGYGVIESGDDGIGLVECGALTVSQRSPIGERLSFFYRELLNIIERLKPDEVAIEQPFVARNVRSALAVGRAQATAILAAANKGVPTFEYTPAQVKRQVANYGASSKEQIQEMVRLHLGLSEVPEPSDAADALAVAICHLQEAHVRSLLARAESEEKA